MKKFLLFFGAVILSCCVSISCKKAEIGSMKDLVGLYKAEVKENVVWGSDSKTIYDTGIIEITKIDKNRVQLKGIISTQGELIDGTLFLDPEFNTDCYGYLRVTYQSVMFGGGVLTILCKTSGELATTPYGNLYPCSSSRYIIGEKVEQ